ncbi:GspE/PulE family protein [Clostridium bornimense]|uniref:GspE/PulE family protein n=1 Tax=Clostridium bornimense TaxID=1216932 RepID=UPI001C113796|nr:GspE/PulE family protein [Clostridium bornimense]MBU5317346.1 GspE/PulE family protein [Clostridium bornimense]
MARKKRIGDLLLEYNYITESELLEALEVQKATGKKLGEIFIQSGIISESDLLGVLELQLGLNRVYIDMIKVDKEVVDLIPEFLAKKYNAFPIAIENGELVVIMNDPLNILAEEDLSIASGYPIKIALSSEGEIKQMINKYYSESYMEKTAEHLKANSEEKEKEEYIAEQIDNTENAPTVKLIDTIIANAVRSKASDIHIEPFENRVVVRYRIDGQLKKQFESSREPLAAMITRIKILSDMDIAEKRIPQDGKILTKVDGVDVDLRVSVLPAVHGEKVVIRILDRSAYMVEKDQLGLEGEDLERINKIINNPYGIVLVTGPTGSGKTTTLYSLMRDLNKESVNIVTVEDPVEYAMDGITQVNVNAKAGLTFASGLRSILRQDPDVVMIGEIRDGETAEIAIRAAITGHLVLSTIHTNDAPSSVMRLQDMGIQPYLVATAVKGIIAQRLVRKICPNCKQGYLASDYEKSILGLPDKRVILYKGTGCSRCNDTGYRGRMGIYEIMDIDADIKDVIYNDGNTEEIRRVAVRNGMNTLHRSAAKAVLAGKSTIDELMRVTMLNE